MRLYQCQVWDLVRLPHHHPAVVLIEDVTDPSPDDGLMRVVWRAGPDEGWTAFAPRARVRLLHRPVRARR